MDPAPTETAPPARHDNGSVPIALIIGVAGSSLFVASLIIAFIVYVVLKRRRQRRKSRFRAAEEFVSTRGQTGFKQYPSDVSNLLPQLEYAPAADHPSNYNHSLSVEKISKGSPRPSQLSYDIAPLKVRDSHNMNYGFADGIPGRLITPPPSPPKPHLPPLTIPTFPPTHHVSKRVSKQLPAVPSDTVEGPIPGSPQSTISCYSQISATSHMYRMVEKTLHPIPPCPPLPPQFSSILQPVSAPPNMTNTWKAPPLILPTDDEVLLSQHQPEFKPIGGADTKRVSQLLPRLLLPPENEARPFQLQPEFRSLDRADTKRISQLLPRLHLPPDIEARPSQLQPEFKPLNRVDTKYVSQLVKARVGVSPWPPLRNLHFRDNTDMDVAEMEHPSVSARPRSSHVEVETMGWR